MTTNIIQKNTTDDTEFKIYIADLAAYNEGYLVGEWVNLPCDNLDERVAVILKKGDDVCMSYSNHEEWAIHDYDLPFNVGESEDLNMLNNLATIFSGMDEQETKKVSYLIEYQGADIQEALDNYENVDMYEDMSFVDLAEMLVDETWDVPDHLQNYIDYEMFARELECDYSQVGNDLFFSQY